MLAVAVAMGSTVFSAGAIAVEVCPEGTVCSTITPGTGNLTNTNNILVANGNGITYQGVTSGHLYSRGDITVSGAGSYGIYLAADATTGNLNIE
ncbi:hypothetical protein [Endozoicomonas sp. SCSIO W0465]|uniref:hypothetical protein n=1 Tax=Endozoicomonas sp. SCSIO W0465 TaxID=2918516 RepID=UPI002074B89B|nr:hypothetical protein [Endozoicomonas sp. SCSIO W0465]USE35113.1 hypothetical protein MJO57_23845 [Endozoicomonas sp. SCSIO W0465]